MGVLLVIPETETDGESEFCAVTDALGLGDGENVDRGLCVEK